MAARLAAAQDTPPSAQEVRTWIDRGMVEVMESRFRGGRTPEEMRWLAQAEASKAAAAREDAARKRGFERAAERFEKCIAAAAAQPDAAPARRAVDAAESRDAYVMMILSQWIAADLDRLELFRGAGVDRPAVLERLRRARKYAETSLDEVQPLAERLVTGGRAAEEEFLAQGIYSRVRALADELRYRHAWACLYVGIVLDQNNSERADALRSAERGFDELLAARPAAEAAASANLGMGLTLRAQGRPDEASRFLADALRGASGARLTAQIRFEQARCAIDAGRFEDARTLLEPLRALDPDKPPKEQAEARFYITLAHLWDAYSYVLESQALAAKAGAAPEIGSRARRLRDVALEKFDALATRSPAWSDLVQSYVGNLIDDQLDFRAASAIELLFAARQHLAEEKYRSALSRLEEAVSRPDVTPRSHAEALYLMGLCYYRSRDTRGAAGAFQELARRFPDDPRASEAAGQACQLWAETASQSRKPEDYESLAAAVSELLKAFPTHERYAEALWWRPVALQSAGKFEEAIAAFDQVPANSPHRMEADYRRAICARQLFDTLGAAPDAARKAAATRASSALRSFAAEAAKSAGSPDRKLTGWIASAIVCAAEVDVARGVDRPEQALTLLADFETRFPDSEHVGRVLAARIAAYQGLGKTAEAAEVVRQFLDAVPPEAAGKVVGGVAAGMLREIDRLAGEGADDEASAMASQALPMFRQLEGLIASDASRAAQLPGVRFALARLLNLAGDSEEALALLDKLIRSEPRNGLFQFERARALGGIADRSGADEARQAAVAAWGAILRDPALRSASPERYWEARAAQWALLAALGDAEGVARAIRQERAWTPELGGPPWRERIEALLIAVGGSLSSQPESGPESAPAGP